MTKKLALSLVLAVTLSACVTPQTQRQKIDSVASEIEARKQRELVVTDFTETYTHLFEVGYSCECRAIL